MHPTDQPKTFVYLHIQMGTINVVKYVNCQLCMHGEQSFLHKTTLWPITLHGLCQVLDSFSPRVELCSTACKKLVPEKPYIRLTDTRASFLYKKTLRVSRMCVASIT